MSNENSIVSIIALVGWLVLMVGAYASYRMDWGKTLKMALIWASLFIGVFLLFALVRGG